VKRHHGLLVAFEGIDGTGKTTQARRLVEGLAAAGHRVVSTREPTDGPWGRRIRASAAAGRMPPEEELRAFVEDRREHVSGVIVPALREGAVVVVDRYYFSSMAYQGARGLDVSAVRRENEAFAPRPDVLVLLRADPAVALARIQGRGAADLFEREGDLRRAAAIFDAVDDPPPLRVDAAFPAAVITDAVRAEVNAALARVAAVEAALATVNLRVALTSLVIWRRRFIDGSPIMHHLATARRESSPTPEWRPFDRGVSLRDVQALARLALADVGPMGGRATAWGAEVCARMEAP